jgi:hypothetical protein
MIKSRRKRWAEQVLGMGEMRNAYKISAGKPEGNGPLLRFRSKRKNNIQIGLKDIELDGAVLTI